MVKSKAKETVYAVTFVVGVFIIVSILFINSLQSGTPVGTTIPTISCPDGYSESRQCVLILDANICDNCLVPVCQSDTDPFAEKLSCGANVGECHADGTCDLIFVRCSDSIVGSCDVP